MKSKNSKNTMKIPTLVKIRKKCYYYLERSRLGGWLVNIILLLLGEWIALEKFPFSSTIIALFALIGITSAGSWINFISDRTLDKFAGKDVDFFDEVISPKEMVISSFIIIIVSLVLLFFINYYVFLMGVLMTLIFIVYSVKPLRLKTKPPLDCIANALVFGTLPFFLGWLINVNWLNKTAILYGLILGITIIYYYLILGSFDIKKDNEYGIKTTCTILGFQNSINIGIILFVITLLLSVIFFGIFSILTLAFLVSSPLIFLMKFRNDEKTLRILLSTFYYLLTEATLLILFFFSRSIFPLIIFTLILIIGVYVFLLYRHLEKK